MKNGQYEAVKAVEAIAKQAGFSIERKFFTPDKTTINVKLQCDNVVLDVLFIEEDEEYFAYILSRMVSQEKLTQTHRVMASVHYNEVMKLPKQLANW